MQILGWRSGMLKKPVDSSVENAPLSDRIRQHPRSVFYGGDSLERLQRNEADDLRVPVLRLTGLPLAHWLMRFFKKKKKEETSLWIEFQVTAYDWSDATVNGNRGGTELAARKDPSREKLIGSDNRMGDKWCSFHGCNHQINCDKRSGYGQIRRMLTACRHHEIVNSNFLEPASQSLGGAIAPMYKPSVQRRRGHPT